jgi:hypothetical protein
MALDADKLLQMGREKAQGNEHEREIARVKFWVAVDDEKADLMLIVRRSTHTLSEDVTNALFARGVELDALRTQNEMLSRILSENQTEILALSRKQALGADNRYVLDLEARVAKLETEAAELRAQLATQKPTKAKERASKADPTVLMQAARLLFSGIRKPEISAKLNLTEHQLKIEWSTPPLPVTVQPDGPIDWFQLWEMETTLSGERSRGGSSWKVRALRRLGLPDDMPYTADLGHAPPEAVEEMRRDYFSQAGRSSGERYKVFERIALSRYPQPSAQRIGGVEIAAIMRHPDDYHPINNHEIGLFAAKFNADHFPLFTVRTKTMEKYASVANGDA